MKKIFYFAAALAVILPSACTKDVVPQVSETPETSGVRVVMNADITPVTRMALSENMFSWEAGDQVNLRWANVYTSETLTATYDAEQSRAVFEGIFTNEIPIADAAIGQVQNLYAFFAKGGSWYSESSVGVVKQLAAQQTGRAEDIDENAIYAAFIKRADIDATIEEGKVTELALNADMRPYFSLVKLNVPAELGLTSITLSADADLTGNLCVNTSKINDNEHNNIFGSGAAQLVNMAAEGRTQSIVVSRGGEVISGDVYFVITPDEYDAATSSYGSSASYLNFTFATPTESFEYESALAEKIQMGELKSLGTVPMAIKTPKVEAGTLCLTSATDFTVSITNPNADCTYYYEIGSSAADCKTPTTSSAQLDFETGIVPEIDGTYDECFIKVLAHYNGEGNYRDCLIKAKARYWTFNKNCPAAAAYRDAANSLASNGSQVVTSDGLIVRRRATNALTYTEGTTSIEYNNCIVPFMQVERSSNVYIYIKTSNYYNNAASKTFNLFYTTDNFSNIGRSNDFNGTGNTKTVVKRPAGSTGENHYASVVWDLGALDSRYKLAFAPDSKMSAYGQGILEVL